MRVRSLCENASMYGGLSECWEFSDGILSQTHTQAQMKSLRRTICNKPYCAQTARRRLDSTVANILHYIQPTHKYARMAANICYGIHSYGMGML